MHSDIEYYSSWMLLCQGWCAVRSEGVQEGVQLGGRVCSKVGGCAVRWEGVQKGSEGVQLGKRW